MNDYVFKIITVGDSGVGKSCLVTRFTSNNFSAAQDITIGVDFGAKTIEHDGKSIKLQIWDTAGQESFRSIVRSYYRDAAAVILCYDITRKETLNGVKKWLDEVKKECPDDPEIMLVGTKSDLVSQRTVLTSEGAALAEKYGMSFIETSAKSSERVIDCFRELTTRVYDKIQRIHEQNPYAPIAGVKIHIIDRSVTVTTPSKKKTCCQS